MASRTPAASARTAPRTGRKPPPRAAKPSTAPPVPASDETPTLIDVPGADADAPVATSNDTPAAPSEDPTPKTDLEKAKAKLAAAAAKQKRLELEISLREQGLPVPSGPTNYSVVQVNRVGVQVRRLQRARDLISAKTYNSEDITPIEIETAVKVLNSALDQAIKTWETMNANRASGGAKETTRIKPLNLVRNIDGEAHSTDKDDEE